MAVLSYFITLAAKSLNAGYRPVILRVLVTATGGGPVPPVVYCDIYFNGTYYKTIAKSLPAKINSTNSEFEFDIQDAAQEFLKFTLPPNGGQDIIDASDSIVSAFVRCRASGINSPGFIIPEGTPPIQGTGSVTPSPGTGLESLSFWILNSALQHEDNQDFYQHLINYKFILWVNQYAPLTHRPYIYYISPNDSDYYPIINTYDVDRINKIDIYVQFKNQTGTGFFHLSTSIVPSTLDAALMLIPAGPKNLSLIFPSLDFGTISNYYIQVLKDDLALASSIMFTLKKSCEDQIRIAFVNYLGTIDFMNFELVNYDHASKSDRWQAPNNFPLEFTKHGVNRLNVSSTDTYICTSVEYGEKDQTWIGELVDTSAAWIAWPGKQGLPDSYLPIVISDVKITEKKEDDRFLYETTIEFTLSNNKITPRN